MNFEQQEESADQGEPVQLFLFRYGPEDDSFYAYTDAEQEVQADVGEPNPVTFIPVPIDRAAIASSGTLDKSTLEIRTPNDVGLASLFRYVPPSSVVQLTIFQGHAEGTSFPVIWVGRVLSASSQDNEKAYSCEPIQTSLRRVGLRRNWQIGCPHLLYGKRCKADPAAASTEAGVVNVSGPLVSLAAGWAAADIRPDFEGGYASWIGDDGRFERRTILRIVDESTVLLSAQTFTLSTGAVLILTKGCPHDEASCQRIHNNINNYGGQSKIPDDNPTGVKNSYY